ncbi:hypothetical protein [Kocuria nitroreducens]|uniref:hypothetical protein n=1 Tax=Kocuria nitroreducens TaxID=3058914 RepID=UPI0036D90E04
MTSPLAPSLSLPPVSAPGTFLAPADPFPAVLAELGLTELQVLHSRVCRQLEQEYLAAPDGPHPVTQDRCQEPVAELDTRQVFLAPPAPRTGKGPGRGSAPVPEPSAPWSTGGTTGAVIHDLAQVHPGDRVEVWQRGMLRCRGAVEEVGPALGVVWLLETGDEYRRMVHAHDGELRRHLSPGGF